MIEKKLEKIGVVALFIVKTPWSLSKVLWWQKSEQNNHPKVEIEIRARDYYHIKHFLFVFVAISKTADDLHFIKSI